MYFYFISVVISPAKAKVEKPNKNGVQKVEEEKDWELVPPDGIFKILYFFKYIFFASFNRNPKYFL